MSEPTVADIMDAMAAQIEAELCGTASPLIPELQVYGRFHLNPSPPAIDIYPADPFTEPQGFGPKRQLMFTVRARVSTADHEEGQNLLLSMMDPASATSVKEAILSDDLGGTVDNMSVEGPSAFGVFPAQGSDSTGGGLLGCTWTVKVLT